MLGLLGTASADYPTEVLADTPVAYWRLDDADGSSIADSSGNGHNGAADGIEDSISFGEPGLLPTETANGSISLAGFDRIIVPGFEKIGADGYSAEYWVKLPQYPEACCDSLVSDGESGGDFWMMNYLIGPGQGTNGAVRPHFGVPGTVSITTNATPLELNRFYHVVTVYDAVAAMGHVYVDGVSVLSSPVTATIPAPGTAGDNMIFIGRDGRENRPSNFSIDEVALYDFPLTAERVAAHYAAGTDGITPPSNYPEEVLFDEPLAYWRLGEAAGPTAADASANGNNATADAGVVFAQASLIPPDADTAVGLSGDPRLVSAGFEKVDSGTSIEFWARFNAAPADGAFTNLVGDGEAANDFHLMVQAGGAGIVRAHVLTDAGTVSVDSPDPLTDERQHHIAATWDATSGDLRLYVDKVEVATANQTGTAINTDNPIYIGRDGIEPGLFDGSIDEVAVYDFPLPPARIAARFNRVDVPPPPPPPIVHGAYAQIVISDGPVAYWRLGEADGSNIFDSSGNDHHGAADGIENSITYLGESLVPAESGNGSITLAGFDRLLIPGFDKIGADGYTAEYWVKLAGYPEACCAGLVGDGQPGGDFFMMNYLIGPGQGDDGAIRPHFSFGNTPVSITTTAPDVLALDTTYHVVTTWDTTAGTGNVYLDGQLVLSEAVSSNPPSAAQNAYPIYIGRDGRENRPSNYMIDEVAMYDYPLSAEQVLNHFNIGINPGPLAPFAITGITFDAGTGALGLTWNSSPVDTYTAEVSEDLAGWFELADSIDSGGNSTHEPFDLNFFFPNGIPQRLYFRVSPD